MPKTDLPQYRKRVYDLVKKIPKGRIMTYGQIAITLGEGYTPRTVGYVMRNSNTDDIPWQRVINSKGGCSTGRILAPHDIQQQLLEAEGVEFNDRGFCKVEEYRWEAF